MTSVADIERAVSRLPPQDLAAFRAWFEAFEADCFDRRISEDAASGKLDHFADEAQDDARRGNVREL